MKNDNKCELNIKDNLGEIATNEPSVKKKMKKKKNHPPLFSTMKNYIA